MKKYFMGIILAAALSFTGCGGGSDGDSVTTSSLKGNWEMQCINTNSVSTLSLLSFTSDTMTSTSSIYSGIGCKDADILKKLELSYSYVLGDKVNTVDNKEAKKISTTVTGIKVVEGTFQNDEIPSIGDNNTSIIYVDDKKLYQGANKEPYTLDYNHYFTKK